ncbi:MAG TPA: NAD-dependent epimerase [Actinobacteria bacterium]|nr:NAD-dependent epimerase [Actinomycetota bacterium]
MSKHLVFGAGPIGSATALELAQSGHDVIVASRSGRGPQHENIALKSVDASNAEAVLELASGSTAIYNCLNPEYTKWATDWPPMANALLAAAVSHGSVYAICSNLYGYGPVNGPISADLPLAAPGVKGRVRAQMWQDALAAHARGDVRVTEVRSSDYVGPGAESHLGERVVPKLLAGKGVRVVGDPDAAHSWTYTVDAARTMVAAAASDQAWGKAWHTPSNPPRSQREAISDMAAIAGVGEVPVKGMSRAMISGVGMFVPMVRELKETFYQFDRPFILDDSETRSILGVEPTDWKIALDDHLSPFLQD